MYNYNGQTGVPINCRIFARVSIPLKKFNENILANASLVFVGDLGTYFTLTGFTVWKSKFGGYNVEVPQKKNFKYCSFAPSFWESVKTLIIDAYEWETIPVSDNGKKSLFYS